MKTITEEITFKELFSMRNMKILGINPPVEDFAFYDLWSKPAGLLYLLNRMRMNGNEVYLLDCIREASNGKRSFGREKIENIEIEKPFVYRGIKRKYHRFGLSEMGIKERLTTIPRPDAVFLTSAMT